MSVIPYIKLFADNGETIEMLSDAEAGRLLKSLLRYVNDEPLILSGNEKFIFGMLKAQIDRDAAGYQGFLDKQRANGAKGGRPRKPTETQQNPENPSLLEKTQKTQEKEKDKEEDKDKDKKKSNTRFAPPTRDELMAYIAEKGYKVDADRWLAYYESNGWKVGRNPMKDWKAAVRTWASNGFDKPAKPAAKVVSGQDYQQRDYNGKKAEMPDWMIQGMKELENVEV